MHIGNQWVNEKGKILGPRNHSRHCLVDIISKFLDSLESESFSSWDIFYAYDAQC